MLKRAPTVYVPVIPEDDGIALPSLLSIVVHAIIFGFIVFSHRIPEIETPPVIETQLVTPGELAQIQAQVIANRAQMQRGDGGTVIDASNDMNAPSTSPANNKSNQITNNNQNTATQDTSSTLRNRMSSIFSRSDAPPDSANRQTNMIPIGESTQSQSDKSIAKTAPPDSPVSDTNISALNQAIAAKRLEYEALTKQFEDSLNEEMTTEQAEYEEQLKKDLLAEKAQLAELQAKKDNPTPTEKPKRVDTTLPPSITGSSSSAQKSDTESTTNKTVDLAAGQPMGGTTQTTTSKEAYVRSKASIEGALMAHIQRHWQPPKGRIGKAVTAIIKVDSQGNVLSVNPSSGSKDAALNKSLEDAVRKASPLTPIVGTSHTQFTLEFTVTS